MSRDFKVGDLVQLKEDSWWLNKSPNFRNMVGRHGGFVVVTDSLPASKTFFYGFLCGHDGEVHLWSTDQFNLVSKVDS